MSLKAEIKILGHGDVQKKIIENPKKPRPDEDHLGPYNKYNDENYQIYLQKRRQFIKASKKYEKLTEETMTCYKTRLHNDYMENLNLDFLKDDSELVCEKESGEGFNGKLFKKRSERPINEVYKEDQETLCNLDTWFKKYLIINKLIWAARTVVLRNRMLKNLEKLKKLDKESVKNFETAHKTYFGCYEDVFGKFI